MMLILASHLVHPECIVVILYHKKNIKQWFLVINCSINIANNLIVTDH